MPALSNGLAVARQHFRSLDRISGVVRLGVYIATSRDFADVVTIADGASELFRDNFGEDKIAARLVSGAASSVRGDVRFFAD